MSILASTTAADQSQLTWGLVPKFSPRMVILVPGGPSRGEMPLTTGGGPIVNQIFFLHHKYFSARSRDIVWFLSIVSTEQ